MSTVDNTTIFIHVASGRYPLTFQNLKQENPYTSFPPNPPETSINNLGYAVVDRVDPPTEYVGVLVEGAPVIDEDDGRYKQNWTIRPFTPEELEYNLLVAKSGLYDQLEQYKVTLYNGGVTFTSADEQTFSVAVHNASINALMITAVRANLESTWIVGDSEYTVHDIDGIAHSLRLTDLLQLYVQAAGMHDDVAKQVIVLERAINLAQTIEDLPVIPPETD